MASSSPLEPDDIHQANERAVQASVEAIVTIDAQQRIVMLNPAALRMFGCQADDVLGQALSVFIPERYREAHAEHVTWFQTSGETERPKGVRGCLMGLRADGLEFPVAATITRVLASGQDRSRGFSTAVLCDLSKEQALEHDIESLRDHFQRLFDVAPIAIWVTERDRIVFCNKACQDLLGSGQIMGRSIYELLHPASHEAVRDQLARALEGGPGVYMLQERLLRPDGALREVEIAIAALPGPNRSTVQMVLSDITRREQERKLLQSSRQELRRLSASMVDAREDERKRIARELHDELGQRLSALKMDLADGANGI
ncbi:MAG: PAS domain S-box protein, partial [Burkholderiaceae bacterium]|nr:PAS domain S-box protein [Burkholderiaceae bacterium]